MPMHTWALWIVRTMERNHRRRAYHLWNISYGILVMTIEGGHISHGRLVMTGLMLDRLGLRSADWVYAQQTGFMLSGLGLCSADWPYAQRTGLMLSGLDPCLRQRRSVQRRPVQPTLGAPLARTNMP